MKYNMIAFITKIIPGFQKKLKRFNQRYELPSREAMLKLNLRAICKCTRAIYYGPSER